MTRVKGRVLARKAAWVKINDAESPEAAKLLDISETGARIELARAPRGISSLTLIWEPVPGIRPLILGGRLKWKNRRFIGLSFTAPDARTRYFLRALVRNHRGE